MLFDTNMTSSSRPPLKHICEVSEVACAKKGSPAPGAQISEGNGQVKRTGMKRRLSEKTSSIGSDEQNLDIPKCLKSSQAPESNELTCGAVAQYACGTCTSSKQSGVPGVSWHKRGATAAVLGRFLGARTIK